MKPSYQTSTEQRLQRAIAAIRAGQPRTAAADLRRVLQDHPRHVGALNLLSVALQLLGRPHEAEQFVRRGLEIDASSDAAFYNHGLILFKLGKPVDAVDRFTRALQINAQAVPTWLGLGDAYTALAQYDKAVDAYDHALELNSDLKYVNGARLQAMINACNWTQFDARVEHLRPAATKPFVLAQVGWSALDQLDCAKVFAADQGSFSSLWRGEIYSHDRIRVAYLSADLREHATAYLMAGLFEQHDRSRFQLTAISFGPNQDSDMRRRLVSAFEHFIDAADKDDQEIADFLRQRETDIVVDLNGFTSDGRPQILARRPAPIQVNYLGYPGTMGASYVDYLIADKIVIPLADRGCYSEKIVYLPNCYQPNDSTREIAAREFSRRECGLPERGFVFCSFNNSYKITPQVFSSWMQILDKVDGSVLWLIARNEYVVSNLRKEAAARKIDPKRLIFAPSIALDRHLARHRLADLFLDTLPYNAHTTASDALWAGLPVLTQIGTTFAGRVAASLLTAVGLPELIVADPKAYERLAVELAIKPEKLAAIREKLAANRLTTPLFDTARFVRELESAYLAMFERHKARKPPDHIAL